MGKIKPLPLHEAQKIAAGEVVERPVNVIKELVENSIDADARIIRIYIKNGGQSLIRIQDDGCGMSPDDAQLCFEHHATSKITSVQDLSLLESFGFRGEALASIAAVSNVTLITKESHAQSGIQLERTDQKVLPKKEVSCSSGTDITITDLFYNVPARKKFLKSAQTEIRHISQLFQALCFDYPALHFVLYSENKLVYDCPPVQTVLARAQQLWPQEENNHLIALHQEEKEKNVIINGIISHHQWHRYDRNHQFFFVNHRWIKNYQLARAVQKGYQNVLPEGKYPAAVVMITMNAQELDVNIHPRKQEIQFLHPRVVEQTIQKTVQSTLEKHLSNHLKCTVDLTPTPQSSSPPTTAFMSENNEKVPLCMPNSTDTAWAHDQTFANTYASASLHDSPPSAQNDQPSIIEQQQTTVTATSESLASCSILGQLQKTYMLLEEKNGLFFIDQHAAHERILYELFKKRFGSIATVSLLFPTIISLTAHDFSLLEPHFDTLRHHGLVIEIMGKNQVTLQAVPVHLKHVAGDQLMKEIIGIITGHKDLDAETFRKTLHEKMHAQMACKAAVKAGDELTMQQMNNLIEDLYQTENRLTCPHGRPTGWLMTTHEIEKKFKRRL